MFKDELYIEVEWTVFLQQKFCRLLDEMRESKNLNDTWTISLDQTFTLV